MWEGVTDAPCGEHGAGTGFVLYVALSRGGELLAVSGTESPLQSQLGPDRGVRWCGHGDISHEDIIAMAATLLHQEVVVLSPSAASTSAVSPRLQL